MPTPYETSGFLGGTMPAVGAPGLPTGSPGDISASYNQAYSNALQQNQALYNNILAGYQQTAAGQRTAQQAIAAGYPQLAGQVQQNLAGVGAAADQLSAAGQGAAAGYGGLRDRADQTLGFYGSALGDLGRAHTDLGAGYRGLQSDVMNTISGIGREQARQIQNDYMMGMGNARQSAISRGLGNTTIQDTMQRGAEFDRARAQNDLAEKLAGLRAGYQSQLGLAGLGFGERAANAYLAQQNLGTGQQLAYDASLGGQAVGARFQGDTAAAQMRAQQAQQQASYAAQIGEAGLNYQDRANLQNTGLAQDQLRWMNSVSAPYPNAGAYLQAAQLAGQAEMANRRAGFQLGGGGATMVPGTGRGVPQEGLSGHGGPSAYPGLSGGGGGFNANWNGAPVWGGPTGATAGYGGSDIGGGYGFTAGGPLAQGGGLGEDPYFSGNEAGTSGFGGGYGTDAGGAAAGFSSGPGAYGRPQQPDWAAMLQGEDFGG